MASIPAPGGGGDSGLAWAEGSLWVGQSLGRRIHRIDLATGAILRTIESNRRVSGMTWVDGEHGHGHGPWEGDQCEPHQVDPDLGTVRGQLARPSGCTAARHLPP